MDQCITRERPDNLPQITLRVKVQCPVVSMAFFFLHTVKRSKTGRWKSLGTRLILGVLTDLESTR